MRRSLLAAFAALAATTVLGSIGLAGTSADPAGTMILNGQKAFPIVLAKGPDPGTKSPAGVDAFAEVAAAGVTFLKVGPPTAPWTDDDIADARQQDTAAAAAGVSTWVNLSTVSQATAGSFADALLARVVDSLIPDASGGAAVGVWKGADEPRWAGIPPSALQFAYCRSTGRGGPGWCPGEPLLDTNHHWVTIEAPRGTAASLQPYSAVTDVHGVDIYPVTLLNPTPNLHDVGTWTSTVASITPSHAVWTTLQVCASGSYDTNPARFVLPTLAQERYMAYDAIINGARSLAFYGGNIPGCWNGQRPATRLELDVLVERAEATDLRAQRLERARARARLGRVDEDADHERSVVAGDLAQRRRRRRLGARRAERHRDIRRHDRRPARRDRLRDASIRRTARSRS